MIINLPRSWKRIRGAPEVKRSTCFTRGNGPGCSIQVQVQRKGMPPNSRWLNPFKPHHRPPCIQLSESSLWKITVATLHSQSEQELTFTERFSKFLFGQLWKIPFYSLPKDIMSLLQHDRFQAYCYIRWHRDTCRKLRLISVPWSVKLSRTHWQVL